MQLPAQLQDIGLENASSNEEFKANIDFAYQDDFIDKNLEELESLASVRRSSLLESEQKTGRSSSPTPAKQLGIRSYRSANDNGV